MHSRACSRHRHHLGRSADCHVAQSSHLIGGHLAIHPSFGPVCRLEGNGKFIEVLRSFEPKRIMTVPVMHSLLVHPIKAIIAQSLVAHPLDLDIQTHLHAQRVSNAALWRGRIVVGTSSDTMPPARQIHTAAAQGAVALLLIDIGPKCETNFGCWQHDFVKGKTEAQEHRMQSLVLSKKEGIELLKLTSSEYLLSG